MLACLAVLCSLLAPLRAAAHPAPFSYLDVDQRDGIIEGSLTVHAIDVAHELGMDDPSHLLESDAAKMAAAQIGPVLASRIDLAAERPLEIVWTDAAALPEQQAIRFEWRAVSDNPGALTLDANLFPYDPQHQTFVNIYEDGELARQWIFDATSEPRTYYLGTAAGAFAVMETFVPAGVHHILIGPDHLLFLVALLLLGGGWRKLVGIVTAFTIGHSITLSLAALDIVYLPGWLIEPAIALSIVVVGADNLLRGEGRDVRPWIAGAFGLIHGFGFASVLAEFGLPTEALGWALFSFNVGVELGQLAVVLLVTSLLWVLRKNSPGHYQRVVVAGSWAVIAAGAFWFVQRVFFPGGA